MEMGDKPTNPIRSGHMEELLELMWMFILYFSFTLWNLIFLPPFICIFSRKPWGLRCLNDAHQPCSIQALGGQKALAWMSE